MLIYCVARFHQDMPVRMQEDFMNAGAIFVFVIIALIVIVLILFSLRKKSRTPRNLTRLLTPHLTRSAITITIMLADLEDQAATSVGTTIAVLAEDGAVDTMAALAVAVSAVDTTVEVWGLTFLLVRANV